MRLGFAGVAEKFVILCFGLFIFLLFFHHVIEPEDIWWHLSAGKWIAAHGQVPHYDPFPFANEKIPWQQNNEWLGSLLLYAVFKGGGFLGLKIFRSLMFILIISGIFFYSRRRLPVSWLIPLLLLVAYGLSYRPSLKPDMFNLFFIQILLIVLFAYENGRSRRVLFILPAVGVLWFNIHIGALFYGVPLISVFLLAASIRFFDYTLKSDSINKNIAAEQVKYIALALFLYLMGFFINPYGMQAFVHPLQVLLDRSFIDLKVTGETKPPGDIFLSLNYFYFFILSALGFLTVFLNKNKDKFLLIVLFFVSFFAFLYVLRNSGFFVLVCAYVIIEGSKDLVQKKIWGRMRWSAIMDRIIMTGAALFLIIQAFNLLSDSAFINGRKTNFLMLQVDPYTSSAVNVLKDNDISGPVFNGTLLGDVILWLDYPQLRPFDDGRHVDRTRFNNLMSIWLDPEKTWPQAERYYGFKIFIGLQEGIEEKFIKYINHQPDWQLIAIRGPVVIYVKRGEFHLPKELNGFEQQLKSDTLTDKDIEQLKALSQTHKRTVFDRFFNPSPIDVDTYSNGLTLMSLGYKEAAAKDFIQALKVSDQWWMKERINVFLEQLSQERMTAI